MNQCSLLEVVRVKGAARPKRLGIMLSDWLESRGLNVRADDGLCAIDVKVDPNGAQRDVSNYLQIFNAASAVLRTCIDVRLENTGGVVKQLGTLKGLFRSIVDQEPFAEAEFPNTSFTQHSQLCWILDH